LNKEKKKTRESYYHSCITSSKKTGIISSLTYKKALVFKRYEENGFSFFCHKIDEKNPFRITEETTGLFVVKGDDLYAVEEKFYSLMKEKTKKDILLKIIDFKKMTIGVEIKYE
jgi:hypothetical protein